MWFVLCTDFSVDMQVGSVMFSIIYVCCNFVTFSVLDFNFMPCPLHLLLLSTHLGTLFVMSHVLGCRYSVIIIRACLCRRYTSGDRLEE